MTPETPKLLNVNEASQLLGVSPSFLNKLRMQAGAGPIWIRLGTRCLYRQADLNDWLEAKARVSTTAAVRPAEAVQ